MHSFVCSLVYASYRAHCLPHLKLHYPAMDPVSDISSNEWLPLRSVALAISRVVGSEYDDKINGKKKKKGSEQSQREGDEAADEEGCDVSFSDVPAEVRTLFKGIGTSQ